MLALGTELARRGHAVLLESWTRWEEHARAAGMDFAPAPEYPVFPRPGEPLKPYAAVARAVGETRPVLSAWAPDIVVHDVLTLAPALSAELMGVPYATLIPHVHPRPPTGAPAYSLGARLPRTAAGRAWWRAVQWPLGMGHRRGERELDELRRRLGLRPAGRSFGGLSRQLVLVGTFPQLEYPRGWAPWEHVVGPLLWEPPWDQDPAPPSGDGPVVLVAPSTAQDPSHRLLRAALAGLAGEEVRVLAAWNRRPLEGPAAVPANTRLVEWVSYARAMARADLVVTHGGHGTMTRALSGGCAVVVAAAAGDQIENAVRADWARVGVRLPWRLLSPGSLRVAVRRALAEPGLRERARELASWAAAHDGAVRAADLVEDLAAGGGVAPRGDSRSSAVTAA